MRIFTVTAVMLSISPASTAHEYCPRAECEKTKQQIRLIQSKLRQGYTRSQGDKLETELRKFRAMRSKKCR